MALAVTFLTRLAGLLVIIPGLLGYLNAEAARKASALTIRSSRSRCARDPGLIESIATAGAGSFGRLPVAPPPWSLVWTPMTPVSCVSCVSGMYWVNATETHETIYWESGLRYHYLDPYPAATRRPPARRRRALCGVAARGPGR
jgi:hypothetical protein